MFLIDRAHSKLHHQGRALTLHWSVFCGHCSGFFHISLHRSDFFFCYGGLNIRNTMSQVHRGNPSWCPLDLKLSRLHLEITKLPLSELTLKLKQWTEFRRCISTSTPPSNISPTPPRLPAITNFNDGRSLSLPVGKMQRASLLVKIQELETTSDTIKKGLFSDATWKLRLDQPQRVQFSAKGF